MKGGGGKDKEVKKGKGGEEGGRGRGNVKTNYLPYFLGRGRVRGLCDLVIEASGLLQTLLFLLICCLFPSFVLSFL